MLTAVHANAAAIAELCDEAIAAGGIGLLAGAPRTGKTHGLEACVERLATPGRALIHYQVPPFIRLNWFLARLLGATLTRTGSSAMLLDQLIAHLGHPIRRPVPVLLDEADRLDRECLRALVDLHELAGAPIVLAGSLRLPEAIERCESLNARVRFRLTLHAEITREEGETTP